MNYEQEEEYLTNDLSRKLMQVGWHQYLWCVNVCNPSKALVWMNLVIAVTKREIPIGTNTRTWTGISSEQTYAKDWKTRSWCSFKADMPGTGFYYSMVFILFSFLHVYTHTITYCILFCENIFALSKWLIMCYNLVTWSTQQKFIPRKKASILISNKHNIPLQN